MHFNSYLCHRMKRLSYITALLLSLLIIYSGAGISIAHYCCATCETVKSCCDDSCNTCSKKSHSCDSKKDCKEEGCTATIYKLDLMKQAPDLTVNVPVATLFCEQYSYLTTVPCVDQTTDDSVLPLPPPLCPRQKLALHSVFLI